MLVKIKKCISIQGILIPQLDRLEVNMTISLMRVINNNNLMMRKENEESKMN